MRVLGVETSCDETSAAIYCSQQGLLSHVIYSQESHIGYGGVVPELASRDHIRKTLPLIDQVIQEAKLSTQDIDGIAYTQGPGLVGALMVGASIARSLGFAWNKPTIGVHHLESHILAVMLESQVPSFPFLVLLVSGGHTLLIEARKFGQYIILGQSVDDAAGEAFDKTAKLLGLSYPGGPALAALAEKGKGDRFKFPRPMTQQSGLDFSFSGLKTFAMTCYQQNNLTENIKSDIACAFEDAVVDTLLIKINRALSQTNLQQLVMVGGVAANKKLRARLSQEFASKNIEVFYPRPLFCTDNAAMVAYTGFLRLKNNERDELSINVKPRWPLETL